jgi:radical SAM protein with 4Fe4S-binding SPASM domain
VNRVIFLLHKPVGQGSRENILKIGDPRVKRLFSLFDRQEIADKAGFDSCSVPALLAFTEKIHPMCIEACEAGRFSAYISPDYRLYPCSFEKDPYYGVSLENSTIESAWNSEPFNRFREKLSNNCPGCPKRDMCFGGCPIERVITLCDREYRTYKGEAI